MVTVVSFFVDRDIAVKEDIASLALAWTALQCFATLIVATNRARGSAVYNWWRLPLKSLVLFGSTAGAVLLGMTVPALVKMAKSWLFPMYDYRAWIYHLVSLFISSAVTFSGLILFYRFAPSRSRGLSKSGQLLYA